MYRVCFDENIAFTGSSMLCFFQLISTMYAPAIIMSIPAICAWVIRSPSIKYASVARIAGFRFRSGETRDISRWRTAFVMKRNANVAMMLDAYMTASTNKGMLKSARNINGSVNMKFTMASAHENCMA